MADFLELAWKVAAPVASGAVGVAGAIWKGTKALEERVKSLETVKVPDLERRAKELEDHRDVDLAEKLEGVLERAKEHLTTFKDGKYSSDVTGLKNLIDAIREDLEKETQEIYDELRGRSKERNETRKLLTKLTERYLALEGRLEVCEGTVQKYNDAFIQHTREQREQWQEINRALGHIEGYLRAMNSRRTSQEFQAPKAPR